MKRIVILTLLLGLLYTASAGAALIVNTCTSTFQITGYSIQVSGYDSVAITTDTQPAITVTKYVKNLRSGVESSNSVPALSGDTVEFRIEWTNFGGTADTITLTDYVPSGLTYVAGSLSDTETNCDTTTYGTATYSANKVGYIVNTVAGSDPGPSGNGIIRFRAKVD